MNTGPQNRRNHVRINLTGRTTVEIGNQALRISGTLLDISLGGARLKVDDVAEWSARQVAVIVDGLKTIADVVWSRAGEIGLRFRTSGKDASTAVDLFEHIILGEYRDQAPTARAWQAASVG
ncbi:MAG: PilZ domain-containing protein [Minwuia sp.]|nr:PilZ domain-containing protein [Minwuia sp.]